MMEKGLGDMTETEDGVTAPENKEGDGQPTDEGLMVPLPDDMRAGFEVGDTFKGTVVDKDGALYVQIEKMDGDATAIPYTGTAPEDKEMNSEESLDKYLKGFKKNRATQ